MGERKGTNMYYPPDYDPKKGGLNKFMGTHALRERARKLHLGILIIRFEMPYNIWCEGCNNHIGMGVRYNAEKTKVGMYYSTPLYQFRMKCHLCNNHFEIKTDPANLDYVIVKGARRQENRWDPTENGQVVPDDKRVIRQLADDAMFKLQHGKEDQTKLTGVTPTLAKLEDLQERWKDDYMANKALRNQFRTRKKEIQSKIDKDNEILTRNSLNIDLLEESADDAKIASLIRLQPSKSSEERQQEKRMEIERKSVFPFSVSQSSGTTPITQSINQPPTVTTKKGEDSAKTVEKQRLSLGISLQSSRKHSNATLLNGPANTTAVTTTKEQQQQPASENFNTLKETTTKIIKPFTVKPEDNNFNSTISEEDAGENNSRKKVISSASTLLSPNKMEDNVCTEINSAECSSTPLQSSKSFSLCNYDYSSSSGSEDL